MSLYTNRRQTRHRIRNKKRKKFVKRLANQILHSILNRALSNDEQVALCHYLNNRGYTYVDTDLEEYFSDEVINVLSSWYPQTTKENLIGWIIEQMELDSFRNSLHQNIETYSLDKSIKNQISSINKFISGYDKNKKEGHRHRKVYFANIFNDINKDDRLDDIKKKLGSF